MLHEAYKNHDTEKPIEQQINDLRHLLAQAFVIADRLNKYMEKNNV